VLLAHANVVVARWSKYLFVFFITFWTICTVIDDYYSLRSIKYVGRMDVSRHILILDTSILATCFMEWRE
jgi:hypothetical protein